jgi:hypothetical protein
VNALELLELKLAHAAQLEELRDSLELAKLQRDEVRDELEVTVHSHERQEHSLRRLHDERSLRAAELERVTAERNYERSRAIKADMNAVVAYDDHLRKTEAKLATLRTAADRVVNTVTADLAESKETGHSHQSNRTIRSYILPLAEALDSIAQADNGEVAPKSQRRETFDPKLVREAVVFLEDLPTSGFSYDGGDFETKGWKLAKRLRDSEHTPSQPAAASSTADAVEAMAKELYEAAGWVTSWGDCWNSTTMARWRKAAKRAIELGAKTQVKP